MDILSLPIPQVKSCMSKARVTKTMDNWVDDRPEHHHAHAQTCDADNEEIMTMVKDSNTNIFLIPRNVTEGHIFHHQVHNTRLSNILLIDCQIVCSKRTSLQFLRFLKTSRLMKAKIPKHKNNARHPTDCECCDHKNYIF